MNGILAFGLPLLLFAIWTIVGVAAILFAYPRPQAYHFLLGPALGFALFALLILNLNHLGFSAEASTYPVLLVLGIGSAFIWFKKRASLVNLLPLAPIGGIVLASLVLKGWPLFQFGLDWLSFVNEDMINYTVSGERLLHFSINQPPVISDFVFNRDTTANAWFLIRSDRHGAEAALASVSAMTHLRALQVFMPLILALGLVFITSATALVYTSPRRRGIAIAAAALLASSALVTLPIIYQLLSQIAGFALLFAALRLICDPRFEQTEVFPSILLAAIAFAGVCALYPEALPFLILPALLWHAIEVLRRRERLDLALGWLSAAAACTAVLLNVYVRNVIFVLVNRVLSGTSGSDNLSQLNGPADFLHSGHGLLTFPYYLVPTGLANFLGAYPLASFPAEPFLSLGIALGFILLALIALATFSELRNNEPSALTTLLCIVLGVLLFFRTADFGLYKLAMYAQPFAILTLCLWYWNLQTRGGAADKASA